MTSDLRPRRLLLSTTELELLRRRVLPPPLELPPGFSLVATGEAPDTAVTAAADVLGARGVLTVDGVHPAVAGDLRVLAAPELAVTVRAALPGLEATAGLAVSGVRGAGLLRTGDTAVELSAFAGEHLARELTRVVPAPTSVQVAGVEEVPLDDLLAGGPSSRLRGRVTGTLHASVLAGPRQAREAGIVGSVEWVWDGGGWTGLEPLPSRRGRPWVRLVPVAPADLAAWLGPLLATAAA